MSEAKQIYHVPVLLNESVDGMNIQPGGIYVDATFGGGGHSKEILSRLDSTAHLYSFDQDEDAEKNIVNDSRFTFVRSNFRYLPTSYVIMAWKGGCHFGRSGRFLTSL